MNLNQRKLLLAPAVFAVVVALGLAAWMFIGSSSEPGASPPVVDSPDVVIHKPWRDAANHVQLAVVPAPSTSPSPALATLDRPKESSLDDLKPVQLDSLGSSSSKLPQTAPVSSRQNPAIIPLASVGPATVNIDPTPASPDVQTIQLDGSAPPAAPAKKPDAAIVDNHKNDVAALADTLGKQIDLLSEDDDVVDPSLKFRRFVMSMCRDSQGRIWSGCEPDTEDAKDGGVWCYDPSLPKDKQWTQYTTANGLGDNYCYAIACDRKGRIWAGHLNHGISVFNGQKWQNYEAVAGLSRPDSLAGPIGERVFHITVNQKDGDVWMATSAGLCRYSESKDTWTYYTRAEGLPSDQASSIAFDANGNIYVATQCDGIAMADAKDDYETWRQVKGPDEEPTKPTGDGLPTNLINDILVAKDGTVYAATDAGLAWSKDNGQGWKFVRGMDWADKVRGLYGGPPKDWKETPGAILAEDYCTCLVEDKDGTLYVGHRQRGVESIDVQARKTTSLGSVEFAQAILTDDGLQIGTYGNGAVFQDSTTHPATEAGSIAIPSPSDAAPPTAQELKRLATDAQVMTRPSADAEFLGDDWRTQGDWVGRYGRQTAILCAARWPLDDYIGHGAIFYDVEGDIGPNHPEKDALRHWMQWENPPYLRCLYNPMVGHRVQSEWDDHGEHYSLSIDGPNINAWVNVMTPGEQRISLYFVNKDGHSEANRYRDYRIEVRQGAGMKSLEMSSVLASARVLDFWGGVYAQFRIRGPGVYCFTIRRNHSVNAICSAVLIDRLTGPTTFVDKVPLPGLGNANFEPPAISAGTMASVSEDIRESNKLWKALQPEQRPSEAKAWLGEIMAYRASSSSNADTSCLANWRWSMRLWNGEDRAKFETSAAEAWEETKALLSPLSLEHRKYP